MELSKITANFISQHLYNTFTTPLQHKIIERKLRMTRGDQQRGVIRYRADTVVTVVI
jgi:hypothetical protein